MPDATVRHGTDAPDSRVMPVAVPPVSTVDRIVDMAPDIVDKIGKFFDKKDGDETV